VPSLPCKFHLAHQRIKKCPDSPPSGGLDTGADSDVNRSPGPSACFDFSTGNFRAYGPRRIGHEGRTRKKGPFFKLGARNVLGGSLSFLGSPASGVARARRRIRRASCALRAKVFSGGKKKGRFGGGRGRGGPAANGQHPTRFRMARKERKSRKRKLRLAILALWPSAPRRTAPLMRSHPGPPVVKRPGGEPRWFMLRPGKSSSRRTGLPTQTGSPSNLRAYPYFPKSL